MTESNEDPYKFTVYIKTQNSKDKITLEVEETTTTLDIKNNVSTQTTATPEEISLIFAGKIMKDTETVKYHGIKDGYTVHMVVRPKTTDGSQQTSPSNVGTDIPGSQSNVPLYGPHLLHNESPPFPGLDALGLNFTNLNDLHSQMQNGILQNPEMLQQFLNNPFIQGIISNPDNIRLFVTSNPQIREIIDRNPEIGHLINNPELLRQTMDLARNPTMLQELIRSHDRAISNLESIPGGYSALQRMYRDIQEPMMNAATEHTNPFFGLINNGENNPIDPQQGQENRRPLPNPWSPNDPNGPNRQTQTPEIPAAPTSAAAFDSMFLQNFLQQLNDNPNLMQNILTSPEMQQMVQGVMNDPALMTMLDQNSGVNTAMSQLLSNPQAMSDLMQMTGASNPQNPRQEGQNPTSELNNTAASIPQHPPEQLFQSQLQELQAMGFVDQQANIRALIASFGDLTAAVNLLLNQPRT